MRLIDADDRCLRADLWTYTRDTGIDEAPFENAIKAIDNAPTIDAVEVVRCKDCRYFKKIVERSDSGLCHRDLVASVWKENGYCSRGERKGGDTE